MGSFESPKVTFGDEAKEVGENISDRTGDQAAQSQIKVADAGDRLMAYFSPTLGDPRETYGSAAEGGAYDAPYSRVGYYWRDYLRAYDAILNATNNYRSDLNSAFDDNRQYLDTTGMQDEWRQYFDRLQGYYGDAKATAQGMYGDYRQDWVDREAYDLWGGLVTGGPTSVQDWFQQTQMGQYLEDQANENFWRQAQLGGQTYNPQEVQEYISNKIVAPEMWQGLNSLADYARMQPELDWRATQPMAQLEQWYAEAVAKGDTAATGEITNLMNQMNQQMWQSNMMQKMSDAELRYLIEGTMPASRRMDYRTAMTQQADMQQLIRLMDEKADDSWDWFINSTLPNSFDQFSWESSALQQATNAYLQAMTNQANAQVQAAGLGAAGSAIGGIAGMFSDRRLKENLKKLNIKVNGIELYTFNYKGDDKTMIGFVADEVEKVVPEAVSTHPSGYKMVDYAKATQNA